MTTVLRWSPLRELDGVERRLRRMLDEVSLAPAAVPAADFYETEREYVVELEVPGFAEEELGIEVSDHQLIVKGERKQAKDQSAKAFRVHERLEHGFERRFELPREADTEHASATFEKGVLEVHTPRALASMPKRVEITKA